MPIFFLLLFVPTVYIPGGNVIKACSSQRLSCVLSSPCLSRCASLSKMNHQQAQASTLSMHCISRNGRMLAIREVIMPPNFPFLGSGRMVPVQAQHGPADILARASAPPTAGAEARPGLRQLFPARTVPRLHFVQRRNTLNGACLLALHRPVRILGKLPPLPPTAASLHAIS